MSAELILANGSDFDMTAEAPGPYRLTAAEFEAMPATAAQLERREAIRDLARAMFTADLSGTDLYRITQDDLEAQPIDHFTPGVYVREFRMRAGLRIVGMRHAQEHISIVSAGRATVYTEHGSQEIQAPCIFKSPAGTQRVLVIHEDMVWQTIHRTDETDPSKVVAALTIDESQRVLS